MSLWLSVRVCLSLNISSWHHPSTSYSQRCSHPHKNVLTVKFSFVLGHVLLSPQSPLLPQPRTAMPSFLLLPSHNQITLWFVLAVHSRKLWPLKILTPKSWPNTREVWNRACVGSREVLFLIFRGWNWSRQESIGRIIPLDVYHLYLSTPSLLHLPPNL